MDADLLVVRAAMPIGGGSRSLREARGRELTAPRRAVAARRLGVAYRWLADPRRRPQHGRVTDPHRPAPSRSPDDWNTCYVERNTPWDTGRPDANLVAAIGRSGLVEGRVLDIGCGSGCEAVWMATRGFKVTGVDLAEAAIAGARRRAVAAGIEATFQVGRAPDGEHQFELIYDCGCFHTVNEIGRAAFVESVARLLVPGGCWISIAGSSDGPDRDHGPPRMSATEIVTTVEPRFEIQSLDAAEYDAVVPTPARAWVGTFRRRAS
ncbi:MAG: methyltransferase domain-containing protein [Myxococcales bacterium FL481]|nr:MAG: methyltransferase domain-containing protein [Myxococcales bacterium FL481]